MSENVYEFIVVGYESTFILPNTGQIIFINLCCNLDRKGDNNQLSQPLANVLQ